ncbi:asparaginase [Algirhabdus cladophorae]|uniref:asparaginase n=1 Tax=Algirhabdus cladophorae TaxID=3377108 RepID=UPI003B847384
MTQPIPMVELWRGERLESQHLGHAVICDETGQIVQAWGDPEAIIYPRSSYKMVQALPLIESGAADAFSLSEKQLALACSSHQGAYIHTNAVRDWLHDLDLSVDDLRCGPQKPSDKEAYHDMICAGETPCQSHNNCSGKHTGFLTLNKHIGGGTEYIEVDHPLQKAMRDAIEDTSQTDSPGYGIDGCSAPNFATTVFGLARSMAFFASASGRSDARSKAADRLTNAMRAYPEMVAGETRACTELMRAMDGKVAIKTGADGVFVAIVPEQKLGVALKISDGASRGSECAIAALLIKLGVLDANHPAALKRHNARVTNWRGVDCGVIQSAAGFPA